MNEIDVIPTPHVLAQQNDFEQEIKLLIPTAGTIELPKEALADLFAPINEKNVEIRPDGLIYMPWVEYQARLRQVFGVSWCLVPQGMPKVKTEPFKTSYGGSGNKNTLCWGFYLMILGRLAGFAIGEQVYFDSNQTMGWSDACEGAKSNALTRLCKGLGLFSELWRPSFIREWKTKNAESYKTVEGKLQWRKKEIK
mgnify:CR=1 FL=1